MSIRKVWVERIGIVGRFVAGLFCDAFFYENIAARIMGKHKSYFLCRWST